MRQLKRIVTVRESNASEIIRDALNDLGEDASLCDIRSAWRAFSIQHCDQMFAKPNKDDVAEFLKMRYKYFVIKDAD